MSFTAGRPLDHPDVKLRFSRNIMPPLVGVLVSLIVLASLNTQWLATKWYMRSAQMPTIGVPIYTAPTQDSNVVTPDPSKAPDDQSRIIIPAIAVVAPVIYDTNSTAEWKIQQALQKGVVHYANTSVPGSPGNSVLFGHSSGYPWADGDYKFIFTKLEKLNIGDEIIIDHKGKRFTYRVSTRRVVAPTALNILDQTDNQQITLVTCHPVGTDKNRLVIVADQIIPPAR